MKRLLLTGIITVLCCPVFSQNKADVIDLLIEAYNLLYQSEHAETVEESAEPAPLFACMEKPGNFYNGFQDDRIGFDLQQINEVFSFKFSDSVYRPLKIPLVITSGFDLKREGGKYHQGIDFELSIGDTVYSVFCGEVRIQKYDPDGYGNVVVVRNYNMSETLYGHLDKNLVRNGQKVTVGQPIGLGGNTGKSTGPHLHFEIRSSGYSFNPIVKSRFLEKYNVNWK